MSQIPRPLFEQPFGSVRRTGGRTVAARRPAVSPGAARGTLGDVGDEPVLHLDGGLASSSRARLFVRQALSGRVDDEVVDDAVLVTSELVTNATVHAGTPSVLEVCVAGDRVVLRVTDADPALPVRRRAVLGGASTGRGLHLLDVLCARWGSEPAAAGKTVWGELRR